MCVFFFFTGSAGKDKRVERAIGVCKKVVAAQEKSPQTSACHRVTHQMGLMPEDGCKNAGTKNGHC